MFFSIRLTGYSYQKDMKSQTQNKYKNIGRKYKLLKKNIVMIKIINQNKELLNSLQIKMK